MPIDPEKAKAALAQRAQRGADTPETLFNWGVDFGRSALSSVPELFGAEPFDGVEEFRGKNPVGGAISSIAGTLVPYVGWEMAATKVPSLVRLGEVGAGLSKSPFVSGAAREVFKLAPFEAARAGSSIALGQDWQDELLSSTLVTGLAGGAGGLVQAVKSAGRVVDSLEGFVDAEAPLQWQIRQLQGAERAHLDGSAPLAPEQLNAVRRGIAEFGEKVRNDEKFGLLPGEGPDKAPLRVRYVAKDLKTPLGEATPQGLSWTFESGFRHGKKLTEVGVGDWRGILQKAGVDAESFSGLVKHPRLVGSKEFSKILKPLSEGQGQLFREGEDGLYLVMKKVELEKKLKNGKQVKVPRALIFKTDSPDKFFPVQAKWTSKQDQMTAWQGDVAQKLGKSALLDISMKTMGGMAQGKGTSQVKNAAWKAIEDANEKFLSPAPFQFKRSILGRAAYGSMQATFDLAQTMARRLAFGSKGLDPQKNEVVQLLLGNLKTMSGKSVKEMADEAFAETGLKGVSKVINEQIPAEWLPKLFEEGKISEKEFTLLREMHRVGKLLSEGEITPLQRITGYRKYRDLIGHYGIPRVREGDYRTLIKDEGGKTLAVFGADSQKEAIRLADALIGNSGRKWTRSEPFLMDSSLERALAFEYARPSKLSGDQALAHELLRRELAKVATSPTFKQRHNVAGFKTEWNADELTEAFAKHLEVKMRYAASLASRETLKQFGDKITILGGAHNWDVLVRRLNDFEGVSGPVARATNEFADKLLGPVLGKNSATKIAGAVNKAYMHLSLGAGNLAYPVTNMMGFLQTSLPMISFIKNAPPERLAHYFSPQIVRARDGMRAVSFIDMMKLAGAGFKQLGSKEEDWLKALNRAADDGTISPRFVEEFVGENAAKWRSLRSLDPRDWARNIQQLSVLGMESGERLSRANALALGWRVGKDFLQIKNPDLLYGFAKQFTDNTMYRYSAADRATIFAGPVGSVFGLFKNWMLHYMNWMFEAAGMAASDPRRLGAWAPLLWQIGGTTAVGGVGAWPMFELVDGFSKMSSNKTVMEHIYGEVSNPKLADGIYYGLPAMLGLSLSQNVEMPFQAPLRDAEFMFMPAAWHRMESLGRAMGDSADWFAATGELNPVAGKKLQLEWAKALAPSTVYRALQVQDEGLLRSGTTGNVLVKDIGTLDRIAWALKLSPTEVDRMFDVSNELWEDQERRKRMVASLGQAMKEAQLEGDFKEVERIIRRGMLMGIEPNRVAASAQSRLAQENGDVIEGQFAPASFMQYKNSLGR